MDPLFSLPGKVALVTGGNSGIGLMIARAFVERGARTYIVGRNAETARAVATELSALGDCRALPADLSELSEIGRLATAFGEQESLLHILVNNAGVMTDEPIDSFSEEAWDSAMDVNIKAPFFLIQKLLPFLRAGASEEDPARIINVGSIGGIRIASRETYSYASAKAGLHHLTRSLARRLGPEHITSNAIAPGPFPSKMMEITSPEVLKAMAGQSPMNRVGKADDVAAAALFFAGRGGGFVNGVILPLDGGITA